MSSHVITLGVMNIFSVKTPFKKRDHKDNQEKHPRNGRSISHVVPVKSIIKNIKNNGRRRSIRPTTSHDISLIESGLKPPDETHDRNKKRCG